MQPATSPFPTASEAWFWTAAALQARREGHGRAQHALRLRRPCEPDDVVRCLDRLFTERRISPAHARVLRVYGERRMPPDPRTDQAVLWREALDRLGPPLRAKGIIA